jgi:hypothetical protein
MRSKLGPPKAITAAAHKLARIIFHMLNTRESYDESVFALAEQKHLQRTEQPPLYQPVSFSGDRLNL